MENETVRMSGNISAACISVRVRDPADSFNALTGKKTKVCLLGEEWNLGGDGWRCDCGLFFFLLFFLSTE